MSSRIISALFVAFSSVAFAAAARADAAAPLELAPDAPDSHVVAPGDTLWGIAAKFLKDPYRWPELWKLNAEQVKNPQRIYPGQKLSLVRGQDGPQLETLPVTRLSPKEYATPETAEIPAIPQKAIEPFLVQPLVAEATALDNAPRIAALQEGRMLASPGSKIYVVGLGGAKDKTWQIYRPGRALIDPDSKAVLGHEAHMLGTARLLRAGEPATLEIVTASHEIGRGDRLVAVPRADVVSYAPHAPKQVVQGRIVGIHGGTQLGSRYSVVTLSRGKQDGLETGHVLALSKTGAVVEDRHAGKTELLRLPDERYGLVFLFRVFDRVSYALVMEATREVNEGDTVKTP